MQSYLNLFHVTNECSCDNGSVFVLFLVPIISKYVFNLYVLIFTIKYCPSAKNGQNLRISSIFPLHVRN